MPALSAGEVTSPEGFKLLKTSAETDAFGVAHFSFPIAQARGVRDADVAGGRRSTCDWTSWSGWCGKRI